MITPRWLLPPDYQLDPQSVESSQLSQLCMEVSTDGFTSFYIVNHKMHISAADLTAGYPLIEITAPATNPITPSTGASRIAVGGTPAASLGITTSNIFSSSFQLNFATPAGAPAGTTIQILLTRNPASLIGPPSAL